MFGRLQKNARTNEFSALVDAYNKLSEDLQAELESAKAEIQSLRQEVQECHKTINELSAKLALYERQS